MGYFKEIHLQIVEMAGEGATPEQIKAKFPFLTINEIKQIIFEAVSDQ